jgi:methionyl-tRNA formyltransferase
MRVAYFGLPLGALALIRNVRGIELVSVALPRQDSPGSRRLTRTLPAGLVQREPDIDAKYTRDLKALAPDLIVSWFWTKKLSAAALQTARLGAFGVHPSLLPRHRGPDPTFWAIDSGDTETGVTAHLLESEYDTGAMLGQKRLVIDPDWTGWRLAKALDRPSLALLCEIAQAYAAGNAPPKELQQEDQATLAPSLADEELELDWHWPVERLLRRIRAAAPWPGAYTYVGDESVTILRAKAHASPASLAIGEAAMVGGELVICAQNGSLAVAAARLEGSDDVLDGLQLGELLFS